MKQHPLHAFRDTIQEGQRGSPESVTEPYKFTWTLDQVLRHVREIYETEIQSEDLDEYVRLMREEIARLKGWCPGCRLNSMNASVLLVQGAGRGPAVLMDDVDAHGDQTPEERREAMERILALHPIILKQTEAEEQSPEKP